MYSQVGCFVVSVLLGGLAAVAAAAADVPPQAPLPLPEANSAQARWLAKEVRESSVLDDMESADHWQHHGPGTMSFTTERFRDGKQSIRLTSPTKLVLPKPGGGRPFGEATLRRVFNKADWSAFNRLSIWVYPTMPGHRRGSVLLKLGTEGERQPGDGPVGPRGDEPRAAAARRVEPRRLGDRPPAAARGGGAEPDLPPSGQRAGCGREHHARLRPPGASARRGRLLRGLGGRPRADRLLPQRLRGRPAEAGRSRAA